MLPATDNLRSDLTSEVESSALSKTYDALLFVVVLGFSAIALLALALAAPLALAVSAVSGAASTIFAADSRRGGWQAARPV